MDTTRQVSTTRLDCLKWATENAGNHDLVAETLYAAYGACNLLTDILSDGYNAVGREAVHAEASLMQAALNQWADLPSTHDKAKQRW